MLLHALALVIHLCGIPKALWIAIGRTRMKEHPVPFLDLNAIELDPLGARISQLLEKPTILSRILESLLTEYDVAREPCAQDLLVLVAGMEQQGLVALSDARTE